MLQYDDKCSGSNTIFLGNICEKMSGSFFLLNFKRRQIVLSEKHIYLFLLVTSCKALNRSTYR